jgi:hypothetical protein
MAFVRKTFFVQECLVYSVTAQDTPICFAARYDGPFLRSSRFTIFVLKPGGGPGLARSTAGGGGKFFTLPSGSQDSALRPRRIAPRRSVRARVT